MCSRPRFGFAAAFVILAGGGQAAALSQQAASSPAVGVPSAVIAAANSETLGVLYGDASSHGQDVVELLEQWSARLCASADAHGSDPAGASALLNAAKLIARAAEIRPSMEAAAKERALRLRALEWPGADPEVRLEAAGNLGSVAAFEDPEMALRVWTALQRADEDRRQAISARDGKPLAQISMSHAGEDAQRSIAMSCVFKFDDMPREDSRAKVWAERAVSGFTWTLDYLDRVESGAQVRTLRVPKPSRPGCYKGRAVAYGVLGDRPRMMADIDSLIREWNQTGLERSDQVSIAGALIAAGRAFTNCQYRRDFGRWGRELQKFLVEAESLVPADDPKRVYYQYHLALVERHQAMDLEAAQRLEALIESRDPIFVEAYRLDPQMLSNHLALFASCCENCDRREDALAAYTRVKSISATPEDVARHVEQRIDDLSTQLSANTNAADGQ